MIEIIEEIPQNSDIFRAITRKSWIRNGVSFDAFLLRTEKNNETELSVLIKANCSKNECEAQQRDCLGELMLKVEAFRNLELQVKHNPIHEPLFVPYHASVYGLPPNTGDTEAIARNIAVELASQATIRPRPIE